MGKRARSEGTIFYSEARQKWVAQMPAGSDGRRPLRTAATEGEALALLRSMHAERAAGRDLSKKAETVKELLDDYMDALRDTVRPATVIAYTSQIGHVTDRIGGVRVDALTPEAAQRLATAISRECGPTAARAALRRLRAACERIVPEQMIRNPVDMKRIKIARHTTADRRPLDDTEVTALLATGDNVELMGHYSRYGIALWLMALLGLRRGEACGVSWRDLNWDKAELHIRQAMAPALGGGFALGPIKTASGVRVIPVGPQLWARLKEHWTHQQAERKLRGAGWAEHGRIVAQENGEPFHPCNLNALLRRLQQIAPGTRHIHPHLLRHTLATLISEEGYSEAVIADILGHSKGGTVTRRYTHATEKAKRNAVVAVENRIFRPASEDKREAQ